MKTKTLAVLTAVGVASAENAGAITTYITNASGELSTVLTAGAGIVGAFFVWRIVKKALNKSA